MDSDGVTKVKLGVAVFAGITFFQAAFILYFVLTTRYATVADLTPVFLRICLMAFIIFGIYRVKNNIEEIWGYIFIGIGIVMIVLNILLSNWNAFFFLSIISYVLLIIGGYQITNFD